MAAVMLGNVQKDEHSPGYQTRLRLLLFGALSSDEHHECR